MNNAAETKSPSMVTTRMGMFIGQGLVVGLNNAAPLVNAAAKKMVDNSLGKMGKEAKKAVDEFMKLAGSTPQQQKDIITIAHSARAIEARRADQAPRRAESNVNQALPKTLAGVNADLKELGRQKQASRTPRHAGAVRRAAQ